MTTNASSVTWDPDAIRTDIVIAGSKHQCYGLLGKICLLLNSNHFANNFIPMFLQRSPQFQLFNTTGTLFKEVTADIKKQQNLWKGGQSAPC